MQKFMMYEDIPQTAKIMYPDGTMKSYEEVIADHPILGTPFGVIGFTTDDAGTVGDLILMGYYDNINQFVDVYSAQGAQVTSAMTNAEKCEVITEFVNNPVSEEDEALDAYLSM